MEALVKGIDGLLKVIEGDTPWKAAWRWGEIKDTAEFSGLLVTAASADCPVTASFLQSAGAWPYYSTQDCPSALHVALDNSHWRMAEVLVRDLRACPYVPDVAGRLPRDLMPRHLQYKLEEVSVCIYLVVVVYRREVNS